ncbi:hypothetical protein [Chryseobacterium sp. MP_3.2]|uniref:hypothetical protein n=1 Tax=Chryseobacterium sp. MP_3.2 TaxID=3071712 RepID=UPI002E003230|nr:hypothetical protein [Chryseobacterium sp. MP_3.2]
MRNSTIFLDNDSQVVSFLRSTGENVQSWFSTALVPTKKISICRFVRENNIRCFRSRKLRNGKTRVSIITKEGREVFEINTDFTSAWNALILKFNS